RSVLWKHIIHLKMPFFDKNESGQLMSRLTDDTKVINEFISQKLPNLLPSVLTIIGSLIMLFVMDWQMTLLTFITIPIFLLIMIVFVKFMQNFYNNTYLVIVYLIGVICSVYSNIWLYILYITGS